MSYLLADVEANPTTYFFQESGGGGGGGDTLNSPAVVLPVPVTGGASLSVDNAAGGGDAVINIRDTTGNVAYLNVGCVGGGNAVVVMGVVGSKVALTAPSSNLGQLQIQNDNTGTSYLTVDTSANNVVVGDLGSLGTVNLNCATIIKDSGGGINGIGLTPTSATTSVISNTIASGGSLFIGSSIAEATTLHVTETGGNGYLEVLGRGSANGVFLAGGANQALVTTNSTTGGQMSIGCSAVGNYDAILITDTPQAQTVIKNLIPPAISTGNNVLFVGPFLTGGNTIPAPVGLAAGVYIMMVNASTTGAYFAQGSAMAYWTGSVWGSGGAFVSASNGTGELAIQPDPTTAGAVFYNNSSGASISASLVLAPLFIGNIPALA